MEWRKWVAKKGMKGAFAQRHADVRAEVAQRNRDDSRWPTGPALDPWRALATLPTHGFCNSPFIFPTILLLFLFF